MPLEDCLAWIAETVESFDKRLHCRIDETNCQIIVSADNRPDDEIALLIFYYQLKVRKGRFNNEDMAYIVKDALDFVNRAA